MTAQRIGVRVLLFATYRELCGASHVTLELPGGATAGSAFEELADQQPRLRELRSSTRFALNRRMIEATAELQNGDELALIQPVSGGVR